MYQLKSDLYTLALQCLEDTDRWFGDTLSTQDWLTSLVHHTLSLAGEAGETANVVKKIQRGSLDIQDPEVRTDLENELTDVFVYLLNIAGMMRMDLQETYDRVRDQNEERFIQQRRERENAASSADTADELD